MYGNPALAAIAQAALPDLAHAAAAAPANAEGSNLRFHAAFLLRHFGDLDGAMKLYQQALEIDESLGDLQGMAFTLVMMGQALFAGGQPAAGLQAVRRGLEIFRRLNMPREVAQTEAILAQMEAMGGDG